MNRIERAIFRLMNIRKERFTCPICGYRGPFLDLDPATGFRKHARCPKCGCLERHRFQFLVFETLFAARDSSRWAVLHFAPEPFFTDYFRSRVARYETADLETPGVDHRVDIRDIPFIDAVYDLVFASHVLEHVQEDEKAICEVRRILRPGGVAILPVPLVAQQTVEYGAPNPHESGHVRAPGEDYYDRYERYFARVDRIRSDSLPAIHQLYIYEDRTRWPNRECPLRPAMPGERHSDVVPVCHA